MYLTTRIDPIDETAIFTLNQKFKDIAGCGFSPRSSKADRCRSAQPRTGNGGLRREDTSPFAAKMNNGAAEFIIFVQLSDAQLTERQHVDQAADGRTHPLVAPLIAQSGSDSIMAIPFPL